jgi:hypothetical protein
MPAPHAFKSKMLAERTASPNVLSFILYYFIYFNYDVPRSGSFGEHLAI